MAKIEAWQGRETEADPERLLGYRETAVFTGMCERKLQELVANRRIPHIRLGRSIRFRRSSLIKWLSDQEVAA